MEPVFDELLVSKQRKTEAETSRSSSSSSSSSSSGGRKSGSSGKVSKSRGGGGVGLDVVVQESNGREEVDISVDGKCVVYIEWTIVIIRPSQSVLISRVAS